MYDVEFRISLLYESDKRLVRPITMAIEIRMPFPPQVGMTIGDSQNDYIIDLSEDFEPEICWCMDINKFYVGMMRTVEDEEMDSTVEFMEKMGWRREGST